MKLGHIVLLLCSLPFIAFGLILFIVSLNTIVDIQEFNAHSLPTSAKILGVKEDSSSDDTTIYYPILSYKLPDGRSFQSKAANSLEKSPEIGSIIKVLYQSNKPRIVYTSRPVENWWEPFTFLVFMLAGLIMAGSAIISYTKYNWLRRHGLRLEAQLVRIETYDTGDTTIYRIFCESFDAQSRQILSFRSEHLTFNPKPYLKGSEIFTVWVSPKNPKSYLVNTDWLRAVRKNKSQKPPDSTQTAWPSNTNGSVQP